MCHLRTTRTLPSSIAVFSWSRSVRRLETQQRRQEERRTSAAKGFVVAACAESWPRRAVLRRRRSAMPVSCATNGTNFAPIVRHEQQNAVVISDLYHPWCHCAYTAIESGQLNSPPARHGVRSGPSGQVYLCRDWRRIMAGRPRGGVVPCRTDAWSSRPSLSAAPEAACTSAAARRRAGGPRRRE